MRWALLPVYGTRIGQVLPRQNDSKSTLQRPLVTLGRKHDTRNIKNFGTIVRHKTIEGNRSTL